MKNFPKDILGDIRLHLEEEKKNVSDHIAALAAQDPFSDTERISDNAASDAEANEESSHDRFSALGSELKLRLNDIVDALSRIDTGTYGFCVECGNMIDTDRLAILPTAKLCRTCEGKKKS